MSPVYAGARSLFSILFRTVWRLRIVGAGNVPSSGPLIVAANHVSYFDPPVLGVALPRELHFMAKQELFRIPVLGPGIRLVGAFPVDRSRGDVSAIKRSVEELRRGVAVGIFPEGTRNLEGTAKPQSGAALLASLSGAPVLPAYIGGTGEAGRLHRFTVVFGHAREYRHEPPGDSENQKKARREELAKWTDDIMSDIFALREQIRDH